MTYEQIVMQIIVNGGDARASALKALRKMAEGNIVEAEELMSKAKESIGKAHEVQTNLIQSEARGEGVEITLLMVHAQDHLMNAMSIIDIAEMLILEKKLNAK